MEAAGTVTTPNQNTFLRVNLGRFLAGFGAESDFGGW